MTDSIQDARPPRFGLDRNSPIMRFWRWWSGELAALLPQWLRQSGESADTSLLIAVTPQSLVLYRRAQGAPAEQGRLDLQPGDAASNGIAFQAFISRLHRNGESVALLLEDAQFLVRRIELPLAALENLRQVLSFEMGRHTPFKSEQVYFGYRLLQQDNSRNRITVKLIAAPRTAVDGSIEQLSRWGMPIQSVYIAARDDAEDGLINLMPNSPRAATPSGARKLNLALLLLTLVLALAAILLPVWQKRKASIALIPLVDRAKQQALEIENTRHEQEKLAAEYNFMLDKKQEVPPIVVVLDELSGLLPDDTWVQQFNLNGKEMQIQGETGSSAKLIPLIESSRLFHNSSFRSPLTKGSTPNSERYHLVAEVKPLTIAEINALPASPPPSAPAPPVSADAAGPAADEQQTGGQTQPVSEASGVTSVTLGPAQQQAGRRHREEFNARQNLPRGVGQNFHQNQRHNLPHK